MKKYNETIIFYRIYDKLENKYVSANVGPGTNRTQSEFGSVKAAREFNCHGIFKDKERYEIHEFKAEISSDCVDVDPMNEEDWKELERRKQNREMLKTLFPTIF